MLSSASFIHSLRLLLLNIQYGDRSYKTSASYNRIMLGSHGTVLRLVDIWVCAYGTLVYSIDAVLNIQPLLVCELVLVSK